jgi:hypothetical protein
MAADASDFMLERKTDEAFEEAKQRAETLIGTLDSMFSEVESAVGGADFGRDAISKARAAMDRAKTAIETKNTSAVQEQIEQLERSEKMFRGVASRG